MLGIQRTTATTKKRSLYSEFTSKWGRWRKVYGWKWRYPQGLRDKEWGTHWVGKRESEKHLKSWSQKASGARAARGEVRKCEAAW